MIKSVEVLISVKCYKRSNKIFQHFSFDNKYILDYRFLLRDKLEEKLKEHSIEGLFIARRNEDNKIILEFETDKIPSHSFFFKISDFVSTITSCSFCQYKNDKLEETFVCLFKNNKIMEKEIRCCKYFKQRKLFKT